MGKLILGAELLTGIADIDSQHRSLVAWTNAVAELGHTPKDRALADRAARFLYAYMEYHFAAEEYAMVVTAYPRFTTHRHQHLSFRNRVAAYLRVEPNGASRVVSAKELHRVLEEWTAHHIRLADRDFASYCSGNRDIGVLKLPSPQELVAFGRNLSDYDEVQYVHGAGEVTTAEVKTRLGGGGPRWE